MTGYDLAEVLIEELGYADSPAFVRSVTWPNRRPIPGVDSAYFVQNIPVAYFSRLSDADPDRLRQLHQDVWNHIKAPLLYVILPQEIHIYNSYAKPVETAEEFARGDSLLRHLGQLTDVETARQTIRAQLFWYDRLHLDTGAFWTTLDGRRIQRKNRADQQLLHAMNQVRRRLLDEGLANDLAYILLGRSIFIRYLEDREILTREGMAQVTDGRADSYLDALDDLNTTYLLFERLSQRFNGDLFPVEKGERQAVQQEHLDSMRAFLDGHDLDSGQLRFWPYDFRYIPIELISGIYDTFLNSDERREAGTYYTPLSLVDFMLDQTLPPETICPNMTVLDPACGSGVFLVRAYQRLVAAWEQQDGDPITAQQLGEILKHCIFGVDINPSAVRIAAFNLYLAMLDYLENQAIHNAGLRFPSLMGTNLIVADFTDPSVRKRLAGHRFDRVIGNPPWGRGTLAPEAARRLKERGFEMGGKQIVQAFLADAPEFCADNGEVALLAPAKSTILVTSDRHVAFRQQFFERYSVESVVNFSALRHELFEDTLSPAVALFYRPSSPESDSKIVYCVPKPSPLSQQLGAIVLDPTEVKYLDREELLAHPWLWKVALWGTPRDAILIERLQKLPTLEQQARRLGWKVREGLIKQIEGKGGKSALWLRGKLFLPMDKFQPYAPDLDTCEPIRETIFHRPRSFDIFRGPLALLRHGLTTEGRCDAAFSNRDIVYTNKVTGVAGQSGHEVLLKWLVAYVNSPLAQYYHFLTSTSWAIERGVLLHREYLRMPFLVPGEKDPRLLKILACFDEIVALLQKRNVLDEAERQHGIRQSEEAIAELVFDIYDLTLTERQLVQDTLDYGIEFFYWSQRKGRKPGEAKAVQRPDTEMLKGYAETFGETATALLRYQDQTLNAVVYQDGAPLSVVGFELVSLADARDVQIIEGADTLQETLRRLDRSLLEQRTPTLYMRRHVRVYDGSWLYLVRPSERRFWTRSQARADADSAVIEWLSYSPVKE